MSQKVNEKPNPRAAVTSKQKVPEPPITGVSPDDPFPGDPDGTTSKPPSVPGEQLPAVSETRT